MAKFVRIGIILFFCCTAAVLATDYCSPYLCSAGQSHIGCGNDGSFSSTCPPGETEMVPITPSLRDAIVSSHNNKRQAIASGNLPGFQPAVRMKRMQWDNELAKLAEFNCKTCSFDHDSCRNTDNFPFSGQNLGKTWWKGLSLNYETIIMRHIDGWWLEYKNANMTNLLAFPNFTPKMIGHFTVMTAENNTHMGCASTKFPENGFSCLTTVCNYASTNVVGEPMYTPGEPASQCTSGKSLLYPSLCL